MRHAPRNLAPRRDSLRRKQLGEVFNYKHHATLLYV